MSRTSLGLLAGALAVWHGWFFLGGYLTTADDVFFLDTFLKGPQHLWQTSVGMAQGHGRIGFYGLMPLNMWAAHLSVFLVWRIVFVALYIGTAALIFFYAARLLRQQIAVLGFLLWLCLHPAGFDHLPPVAYPVQNTLPVFILVALRLWALERGEWGLWMVLGRGLQIVAMLLTEFAALIGFAMIAAETFVRHPLTWQGVGGWLRATFADRITWRDVITVALVLCPYIGYRIAFPSNYIGNQIDGAGQIGALATTTVLHVLQGLVLFRLDEVPAILPEPEDGLIVVGAVLAGVAMTVAVWQALRRVSETVASRSALVFLLGAILLVTLPLTATTKQQELCIDYGSCSYLDSRSSIFGVVLLGLVVLGLWRGAVLRVFVAAAAGGIFAFGSLYNWQVAQQMQPYARVWERAEALACAPDLVPQKPAYVTRLIDPESKIQLVYAPWVKDSFWPLYLSRAQDWSACADDPVLAAAGARAYLPLLQRGAAPQTDLAPFLGEGWFAPEAAGTWSAQEQAQLTIVPTGLAAGARATLVIQGMMFFEGTLTRQRIMVSLDDQILLSREITAQTSDCCRFEVPLPAHDPAQEVITLTLRLPDATRPAALPDGPQLGMFLQTLALR
jgi:hypothetical protein